MIFRNYILGVCAGWVSLFMLTAQTALAQQVNYVSLSKNLPFIGTTWKTGAGVTTLINNLLGISVGLAAGLAVIMLTVGGFKYMTSDSVFNMGGAKEQMTNAIVGLLIVLVAVLILKFINPDIVSLRLFQ